MADLSTNLAASSPLTLSGSHPGRRVTPPIRRIALLKLVGAESYGKQSETRSATFHRAIHRSTTATSGWPD